MRLAEKFGWIAIAMSTPALVGIILMIAHKQGAVKWLNPQSFEPLAYVVPCAFIAVIAFIAVAVIEPVRRK